MKRGLTRSYKTTRRCLHRLQLRARSNRLGDHAKYKREMRWLFLGHSYHASPAGQRLIDETLVELIAEDVIEKNPILLGLLPRFSSSKGEGSLLRRLSKSKRSREGRSVSHSRIDNTLSQVSGKTYLTTFDINKGFRQIEIDPKDQEKTALLTGRGLR